MRRAALILCALSLSGGCGSRPAATEDSGATLQDSEAGDSPVAFPDGGPTTCDSLELVGQLSLEAADTHKTAPRIAFDGARFAVIWHSQLPIISSMNGELRFALVDRAAKTDAPDGVVLGKDNGVVEASLLASPAERSVLHNDGSTLVLRRVDAKGQTTSLVSIGGEVRQTALASHATGVAALLAGPGSSPWLVLISRDGEISSPTYLHTAELMASLWLGQRSGGGYAAALYSANSNASLHLLDPELTKLSTTRVGHSTVRSPAFTLLPDGVASVYVAISRDVESEIYDAGGARVAGHAVGKTDITSHSTNKIAAAYGGGRIFAVYPGPSVPGQLLLHTLSADGKPAADPIPLPRCLATASAVSAAWGRDQLAIASLDYASGLPNSAVCVTLMQCR